MRHALAHSWRADLRNSGRKQFPAGRTATSKYLRQASSSTAGKQLGSPGQGVGENCKPHVILGADSVDHGGGRRNFQGELIKFEARRLSLTAHTGRDEHSAGAMLSRRRALAPTSPSYSTATLLYAKGNQSR